MKITPFKVYKAYVALKAHFTGKYDFFKYNGRMKVKIKAFENRKDKEVFTQLAKHKDPYNYILANFVEDLHVNTWGFRDAPYTRMTRVRGAIHYNFEADIKKVSDILKSMSINNGTNEIIVMYMSGKIEPETVCILNKIFDLVPYWRKNMSSVIYDDIFIMIEKYEPFLDYDLKKCKNFLRGHYKDYK